MVVIKKLPIWEKIWSMGMDMDMSYKMSVIILIKHIGNIPHKIDQLPLFKPVKKMVSKLQFKPKISSLEIQDLMLSYWQKSSMTDMV